MSFLWSLASRAPESWLSFKLLFSLYRFTQTHHIFCTEWKELNLTIRLRWECWHDRCWKKLFFILCALRNSIFIWIYVTVNASKRVVLRNKFNTRLGKGTYLRIADWTLHLIKLSRSYTNTYSLRIIFTW